jgi:CRISPR system Cascade subunit CasA
MPPSFNLAHEPFIPCVLHSGSVVVCGLKDALLDAHNIAEIRDESPLVTVAIHRLLLAILHRCYQGPRKPADRIAIKKNGAFDGARIKNYFAEWADRQNRFDLFHKDYPFYQRAGFSTREPSGINRLAQELSRGNNAALFDHTTDDPPPTLTPARAACLVIAEQAFAVGGGKSDTGNTTHAPLVAGAVVLAHGASLFETLWLNLTIFSASHPFPSNPDDAPIWERPSEEPHKRPTLPSGYLDYLTWQSRTLRLVPEESDGKLAVSRVNYAQGRKFAPERFFDPMVAYFRRKDDEPWLPVRFNEFRDLWRDSAALYQVSETHQKGDRAPTCLHTLSASELREVLPRYIRCELSVFGLCTDKAKVNFWRHESLPLPLAYLDKPDLVETLKRALGIAEIVAGALRKSAWVTVANWMSGNPDAAPDKERVGALVDSFGPSRLYWSRLDRPFRNLLIAITAQGADLDVAIAGWYWETLHRTAITAFDESVGRIDGGRDLKASTTGRRLLYSQLKKIRKDNRVGNQKKVGVA